MTTKDAMQNSYVIAGTLHVNSINSKVLIDSVATRSFISREFVHKLHCETQLLNEALNIEITNQDRVPDNQVCPHCEIEILGHRFYAELIFAREHYYLYPRFLQTVLEHRLTKAQLNIYQRSRMVEPPVLSLRPTMVLLNNAHYPNVVLPTRITDPIHELFNALDQVVQDV